MNSPKVALEHYTNEHLVLIGPDLRFDVPWQRVLMLSQVHGDYFVCLIDGSTSFEVTESDYRLLEAVWLTKLAGNRLNDFSKN